MKNKKKFIEDMKMPVGAPADEELDLDSLEMDDEKEMAGEEIDVEVDAEAPKKPSSAASLSDEELLAELKKRDLSLDDEDTMDEIDPRDALEIDDEEM